MLTNPIACLSLMSSMIADLVGALNNLEKIHEDITYKSVLFPAPATNQQLISAMHPSAVRKTYVYRGSTRVIPPHSIFLTLRSRRTMLQSHYVVILKRGRDLSTGQGERAIAAHLTRYRQSRQQKVWEKEQTLHLFCFVIRRVMDHTQDLCTNCQTLILGQSIQFLEGTMYPVLPPQQLHEFLCDTLSTSNVSVT